MPTYLQLAQEPDPGGAAWRAQFTPPNMTAHLLNPLRAFYKMGPTAIGAAGDNFHLDGRHRSRDWCISSTFCTNKFYGTTDARDRRGNGSWYRGFDVGISGPPLWDACHRIDAEVRAGRLPQVAEWFGTFDGKTVVGWFQGHASSSDSSHLSHFHGGVWTESADDPTLMRRLFELITGTTPAPPVEDDMPYQLAVPSGTVYVVDGWNPDTNQPYLYPQTDWNRCLEWQAAGMRFVAAKQELTPAYWDVDGPDEMPITLTSEQMAALTAEVSIAAKEGAEAGAPTQAELEDAAFEGAQRAEGE